MIPNKSNASKNCQDGIYKNHVNRKKWDSELYRKLATTVSL